MVTLSMTSQKQGSPALPLSLSRNVEREGSSLSALSWRFVTEKRPELD